MSGQWRKILSYCTRLTAWGRKPESRSSRPLGFQDYDAATESRGLGLVARGVGCAVMAGPGAGFSLVWGKQLQPEARAPGLQGKPSPQLLPSGSSWYQYPALRDVDVPKSILCGLSNHPHWGPSFLMRAFPPLPGGHSSRRRLTAWSRDWLTAPPLHSTTYLWTHTALCTRPCGGLRRATSRENKQAFAQCGLVGASVRHRRTDTSFKLSVWCKETSEAARGRADGCPGGGAFKPRGSSLPRGAPASPPRPGTPYASPLALYTPCSSHRLPLLP